MEDVHWRRTLISGLISPDDLVKTRLALTPNSELRNALEHFVTYIPNVVISYLLEEYIRILGAKGEHVRMAPSVDGNLVASLLWRSSPEIREMVVTRLVPKLKPKYAPPSQRDSGGIAPLSYSTNRLA